MADFFLNTKFIEPKQNVIDLQNEPFHDIISLHKICQNKRNFNSTTHTPNFTHKTGSALYTNLHGTTTTCVVVICKAMSQNILKREMRVTCTAYHPAVYHDKQPSQQSVQ
jgi:hypothetical protein